MCLRFSTHALEDNPDELVSHLTLAGGRSLAFREQSQSGLCFAVPRRPRLQHRFCPSTQWWWRDTACLQLIDKNVAKAIQVIPAQRCKYLRYKPTSRHCFQPQGHPNPSHIVEVTARKINTLRVTTKQKLMSLLRNFRLTFCSSFWEFCLKSAAQIGRPWQPIPI